MSRPNLSRNDRMAQMTKQEELIAKKRQEILEKQKTAELAKAVAAAQSEVAGKSPIVEETKPVITHHTNDLRPKVQNTFCNDGSFLTHFKKILESAKEKEKKTENIESDDVDDTSKSKSDSTTTVENPNTIELTTTLSNESDSNDTDSSVNTMTSTSIQKTSEINEENFSEQISQDKNTFSSNTAQYNPSIGEQQKSISSICNVNVPPPNIPAPPPPPPSSLSLSQQNHSLYPSQSQSLYYNPNIPPPSIPNPNVNSNSNNANPPPPLPSLSSCLPLYMIPPPEPLQLNKIPPPKELDLNAIPQPELNLDAIKVPELDLQKQDNNEQFLPTTLESLIELVAENGDAYEDKIRTRKNELQPTLWFLFNKDCPEYNDYRRQVIEYRNQKQKIKNENENKIDDNELNKIEEKLENENKLESNDDKYDPESVCDDSDDEYMKDIKERNLGNLKRKLEGRPEESEEDTDDDDDDDDDDDNDDDDEDDNDDDFNNGRNNECRRSLKMAKLMTLKTSTAAGSSLSSSNDSPSTSTTTSFVTGTMTQLQHKQQQQNRQQRKRKSRWGGKVDPSSQSITAVVQTNFANQNKPILSAIQRTDPALLQYARQNYGTINLSEEDWRKCEDHFKVNLLYQDMMRKRREIDMLAKTGKFKYEYDSDEDTKGGTWEHKLRTAEMEATKAWADALTQQSQGKHHIGDFLPPEELKKFMEKYEAKKNNRQPDLSDYKEYKLKEDNIGFQMLQKLGWKEGQGLGASGEGIVDPINKAPQRDANQGLGAGSTSTPDDCDNEYDAYRKRMMLAYRFRPNPLNNPRRAYY